jgi:hypothetical protein
LKKKFPVREEEAKSIIKLDSIKRAENKKPRFCLRQRRNSACPHGAEKEVKERRGIYRAGGRLQQKECFGPQVDIIEKKKKP